MARLTAFQDAVLDWAEAGAAASAASASASGAASGAALGAAPGLRDLPWRRTRDPWAVLVSEVMLQQTQVARVIPRWHEFLARFPDPAACAAATAGDVIGLWVGLGYNRRAVQLHRAAIEVVARHGGRLPSTLAELKALPGIGPYTARAVLAFAFEQAAAVVDTNVARVLARAVAGRALTAGEAQASADSLVPAGQPWLWNQAMLDLGAMHCTSSEPRCGTCPLASAGQCRWARARACAGAGALAAPDPARGSAGVSGRQSAFAGSDRQGRGRLVKALQEGAIGLDDWARAAEAAGWPGETERAARAVASLVVDGLAIEIDGQLQLP